MIKEILLQHFTIKNVKISKIDFKVLYNEFVQIGYSIINIFVLITPLYLTYTWQEKSVKSFYSRFLRMKLEIAQFIITILLIHGSKIFPCINLNMWVVYNTSQTICLSDFPLIYPW